MNETKNASTTLALQIGARRAQPVRDFAHASEVYHAACEQHAIATGRGASTMPEGRIRDASKRLVARVSWNGKVWPNEPWSSGVTPLYTPPATECAR